MNSIIEICYTILTVVVLGACNSQSSSRMDAFDPENKSTDANSEYDEKEVKLIPVDKLTTTVDVKQPGSNLYWWHCPVGQKWEDGSCKGKVLYMNWEEAKHACPLGFRLPTRNELLVLLGGCDQRSKDGKWGQCNSCNESYNCSSIFNRSTKKGQHYEKKKRCKISSESGDWGWCGDKVFDPSITWSSSPADEKFAWQASFDQGWVINALVSNKFIVRCVRLGSGS